MPAFDVQFEVYCDTCGAGLCNNTETVRTHTRGELSARVTVCEACCQAAWDKGYEAGHENGYREAEADCERKSNE